jgi:hypothetical protein
LSALPVSSDKPDSLLPRGRVAGAGPSAPAIIEGTAAAPPRSVINSRRLILALETIAKLPTAPAGPLNDNEIDEINSEIATLKTLPPMPAKPPTEAAGAQSRLEKLGEKVLESLATDAAKWVITAGSAAVWSEYGNQLIALARTIGEWIASLPP